MKKALLTLAVILVAFAAAAAPAPAPAQETTCAQCFNLNLECCVKPTGATFCCTAPG